MKDGMIGKALSMGARGLKASGDAVDGVAKFTRGKRGGIVDATRGALEATGRASENAGRMLDRACGDLAQRRSAQRPDAQEGIVGSAITTAADYAVGLGGLMGRSIDRLGATTRRVSPAIGEATGSMVVGTVGAVSGAVDALAITRSDYDALGARMIAAGKQARAQSAQDISRLDAARRGGSRDEVLDLLTVGGVTVGDMAEGAASVPVPVEHAFELAYPGLAASGQTFSDAVGRLPTEDVVGLVSGVKGKLFEIELVDQLNHGALASGLHAELATSATQPGYDILIRDAHGHAVDVLQAKATESVEYVRDALARYPNIDISTTSEVHRHLMTLGLTDHVSDSGISSAALQHKVEAAAGLGHHLDAADFIPSSLGLAVIALSAFTRNGMSWEARAGLFGDRVGKAGVAGMGAKAMLVATGAWWMALAGGIGLRVMSSRGDYKRRRLDALKGIVESMEAANRHPAPAFRAARIAAPVHAGLLPAPGVA